MADTAVGRVALFSIHPAYARAILDGSKKVEFRRQGLPGDVTHVVIYSTSPEQLVVGAFEIGGIDCLSPTQAWRHHHSIGGIEKPAFEQYYGDARNAYVIQVSEPAVFEHPFPLTELAHGLRPPQSYLYLTDDMLDRVGQLTSYEPFSPTRRPRQLALLP